MESNMKKGKVLSCYKVFKTYFSLIDSGQLFIGSILATALLLSGNAFAVNVSTLEEGQTAVDLATKVQSGGITIDMGTVTYTGADVASGIFTNGVASGLDIDEGIIMTTGHAKVAEVKTCNTDPKFSFPNGGAGDSDLDALLTEHQTQDASVLQFELTTSKPLICVQYVFASEEYNEFDSLGYNDIFAFFIRKKGDADWTNLAMVPGTTSDIPVSVETINDDPSSPGFAYYRDNNTHPTPPDVCPAPILYPFEYDGFTRVMCAETCDIVPGEPYELKMAIADVKDDSIDTAVFISAITDEPQSLSIMTTALPSQEVGSFYSTTIEADGSLNTDYIWEPCVETALGVCSCVTAMSPGLSSDLLAGNCPAVVSNGAKTAELSWVLPVVPEGEYIDIRVEVWDQEEQYASAAYRYTDPEVAVSSGGGGAGAGGGGGCFITTASYGGNSNTGFGYTAGVLLLISLAVIPFTYRRGRRK